VVVDAYLVAHPAAEQFVDRHAEVLALDVPERLLDAADRRHPLDADLPEMLAVGHLIEVLDPKRIFPHQQLGEVLDRPRHRAGLPLEGRFAPTVEPRLIGFDFNEDPVPHVGIDNQRRNPGDFHHSLFHVVARAGKFR